MYELNLYDSILNIQDDGVHAGMEQCSDSYYVSDDQAKSMDDFLKFVVGARKWASGDIIVKP